MQKIQGGKIKGYNKDTWTSEALTILFKGQMKNFKQIDHLIKTENCPIMV